MLTIRSLFAIFLPGPDFGARVRMAMGLVVAAVIAAVFLAAFYDPAAARPDTRRMSCVQAQNLVQQSGAVVLSYGQYVYDRFVADRRYCQYYEETAIRVVPAEDTPRCRLLHCRPVVIFPPISPGR